jgi:hypothetical protein
MGFRAGLDVSEKSLLPLPKIKSLFLGHPIRSLITTLTELSKLIFVCLFIYLFMVYLGTSIA